MKYCIFIHLTFLNITKIALWWFNAAVVSFSTSVITCRKVHAIYKNSM